MNKKYFQQKTDLEGVPGFTLIELLVVVAIIALLAATILASLGSARTRARSARMQSEISSMRAAAELYYNENGTYAPTVNSGPNGVFADGPSGMGHLVNDVTQSVGTSGAINHQADDTSWAFQATLPTGEEYCADSNGFSGVVTQPIFTAPYACTP